MRTPVKRFLVMLCGCTVAAGVITVLLAPPTLLFGIFSFAIIMIAAILLSYIVGYLGTPWSEDIEVSYKVPTETPSTTTQADIREFRWAIREGIGMAIASLFGLLLLVLFLMEETELVSSTGVSIGEISELFLLVIVAIALAALALWSWKGR